MRAVWFPTDDRRRDAGQTFLAPAPAPGKAETLGELTGK
jgi:hypothetical protein